MILITPATAFFILLFPLAALKLSEHYHKLYFVHPLFTESILPNAKLRFNFEFTKGNKSYMKTKSIGIEYKCSFKLIGNIRVF